MSWFVGWFATMNLMKIVGIAGQVVFGSRFFVQWFASEKAKRSVIPIAFWYLSFFGGILTLIYAIYIQEPVFIFSQVGGLIIYSRNLMFVYRDRNRSHALLAPDRS
jgi:lipid-A-disaccharide synthase-like uncharacterized protein